MATTDPLMKGRRNGSVAVGATAPEARGPSRERRRARSQRHAARLYGWAALLMAGLIVLIALAVANSGSVRLDWVIGSSTASLALFLFVAAVAGWLVGIATSAVFRQRTRARRETVSPVVAAFLRGRCQARVRRSHPCPCSDRPPPVSWNRCRSPCA